MVVTSSRGQRHGRGAAERPTVYVVDPRAVLNELIDELRWDSRLDESKIVPGLAGGVAVLQGNVSTYSEWCWAQEVAKRVHGVTAVHNELEVKLTIGDLRSDEMLRRIIVTVLDALSRLPDIRPRVDVLDGRVVLSGVVHGHFQKMLAEEAVRHIAGIRAIDNQLIVTATPSSPANARTALNSALHRHLRDCSIRIAARGSRITLRGTVRTCEERDAAINLAWNAPGITSVDDHLVVRP